MSAFLSALSQGGDENTAAVILLACCLVALFMLVMTRGLAGAKALFTLRSGGDRPILGGGPSDEQLPSAEQSFGGSVIAGTRFKGAAGKPLTAPVGLRATSEHIDSPNEQRRVLALIAAFDVRHEGRR